MSILLIRQVKRIEGEYQPGSAFWLETKFWRKLWKKKKTMLIGKLILRSLLLNCSLQIYEETIFFTAQKNKLQPFFN